jgi:hypothetical protein
MRRTAFMRIGFGVFASTLVVGGAPPVEARDTGAAYPSMAPLEQYLIADRKAEIALAQSAAPPSISAHAAVMVLTRRGYETAVEGKNGFVCLVDRSWQSSFGDSQFWNPKIRAPVCVNPQAARSVLPVEHKLTELALAGLSQTEMLARMKNAVDKKELGPPEIGAMSYMMSKEQVLNDGDVHWHPHLAHPGAGKVQ